MATTRKAASQKSKTTTVKAVDPAPVEQPAEKEIEKIVAKEIDLHEYIPVRNGTRGKLVYVSPRTGERFVWEDFGDTQEMELQELRNAKSSSKKFFERNWFMFDDDYHWVVDYLGLSAYYKHTLPIDNFDDVFKMSPKELTDTLKYLGEGQKRSVSYRARQLIADGEIDSMRLITALEKELGIELIER